MTKLQIFVAQDCWGCEESRRLAAEVRARMPWIDVELVDLNSARRPSNVFAAPTYLLDGKVIFLGNPRWNQLHEKLVAYRSEQSEKQEA